MADLFAFKAEGNALSEDRVVISKVEKSKTIQYPAEVKQRCLLPLVE
jgi:hypothetical protein